MSGSREELSLSVPGARPGEVDALLEAGSDPRALLVLAHGAGAGMRHAFMDALAERLVRLDVAVLRYQFPYMQAGGRRPDRLPVATATVRAAVARARALVAGDLRAEGLGGLPLFAGGKSFGGRMASAAAAERALEGVSGLVFFGFPLHPAGKPGTERAAHLADVPHRLLFLQGTRDALAELDLVRGVVAGLPGATLLPVEGADHGFHVLKRSGRSDDEVLDELAREARDWMVAGRP